MRKILVTGNAGSGKSTLSKKIAHKMGIEVHSLDKIVWQPGWKKTKKVHRDKQIKALVSKKTWVIDGVSTEVLKRADTIIFLDVPRRVCFMRVTKRNWRYLFRSRPELPENCPEILIMRELIKIIWNFPKNIRPQIVEELNRSNSKKEVFHVRNNADLERMMKAFNL